MQSLGPCPECGHLHANIVPIPYSAADVRYKVECASCGFHTAPAETELEARVIWNDLSPAASSEVKCQKEPAAPMVFLVQGHTYLGTTKRDGMGNIVESTPARFESSREGPCIAVGMMDPDTTEQVGDMSIFGDYNAEGYLSHVLELLKPTTRRHDLPDIKGIVRNMANNGIDICDYCPSSNCFNCAVHEWTD